MDSTVEETEVKLTFAKLSARGDESDADGAVVAFIVQTVVGGTLRIGTNAEFAAGSNDRIDATQNAY